MKRRLFVAFLLLTLAASAYPACTIQITTVDTPEGLRFSWTPVAGATMYAFEESPDRFNTTRSRRLSFGTNEQPAVNVLHITSDPTLLYFRVTAINPEDPSFASCSAEKTATFAPNPEFRNATRKSVIPLVGSTPGAFGARFKTSLKLRASYPGGMRGRLVFHPVGVPGSDDDPSIAYELPDAAGSTIEFDDIVAAFGRSGLGSIDIVPQFPDGRVPLAETRLFNETSAGTYGTFESQIQPFDFWVRVPLEMVVPDSTFRLNIGLRSFTWMAFVVRILDSEGNTRAFTIKALDPDTLLFGSAEQIVGQSLSPGDRIVVESASGGGGVPFYTLTENRTNDPSIIVPAFPVKFELRGYTR